MKKDTVFYFDGEKDIQSYEDGDMIPAFKVKCKYDDYHIDFKIFQTRNGDYDEAWDIDGHIKNGGCSNWQTNPECMLHLCGIDGWMKLNNLMVFLFEKAEMYFESKGI